MSNLESETVSIIVPIYNVERYIKRCVESIQMQDYKNIEILLIDDGSTDNSGKIIDDLSQYDTRIKIFHKKNGGVSSARNLGLKVAKGIYIQFIDGDDYIESDHVSRFVKLISDANTDVAVSRTWLVNDQHISDYCTEVNIINSNIALRDLYLNKIEVAVWNKIYRKSFLIKNQIHFLSNFWFAEGMTFNVTCFSLCDVIAVSNLYTYHQVSNPNSAVRKFNLKSWLCGMDALRYQKEHIFSGDSMVINAWHWHFREYYFHIMKGLYKNNLVSENYDIWKSCIKNLRKGLHYPLFVDIGIRAKVKSIFVFFFPVLMTTLDCRQDVRGK